MTVWQARAKGWGQILCGALLFLWMPMAWASDSVTDKAHDYDTIPYPKVEYGTGEQAKLIKRGEYLVKVGDCISCHTDSETHDEPFAGGLGIVTPFGTFYGPNITPDKKEGIGNWTSEDFIRALHKGKNPDGKNYFPVFPYTSFTRVTEEDLLAIKAYLFALSPSAKPSKKHDVGFPFSWRFLQLGWKLLFFEKGVFKPDPTQTAQYNRGAYLVQGLGHCAECHTPRNPLGGMQSKYFLTGGFVDGYFAPDITAYGIKEAPVSEVVKVFTEEKKLHGAGRVRGPMEEVDHNSLQYLDRSDLEAMAVYLKALTGVPHKKVKMATEGKMTTAKSKKLYKKFCAACHDTGAAGAPKMGDVAEWEKRQKIGYPAIMKRVVNGWNSMPARGTCTSCSDTMLDAIVTYMIDQNSNDGEHGLIDTAQLKTPKPKKLTIAEGKVIYEQNCAICHDSGGIGAPKLGDQIAWEHRLEKNLDKIIDRVIHGHDRMPARGACIRCTDGELISATKYMVQVSTEDKDNFQLW